MGQWNFLIDVASFDCCTIHAVDRHSALLHGRRLTQECSVVALATFGSHVVLCESVKQVQLCTILIHREDLYHGCHTTT